MPPSTLDPDNLPFGQDSNVGRGHGTRALGPSDSSDSGSDLRGAPGMSQDTKSRSRRKKGTMPGGAIGDEGAGADIGDPDLDSDTDSGGTGERAAATTDLEAPDGADIDTDHIESINPEDDDELDFEKNPASRPEDEPGRKK